MRRVGRVEGLEGVKAEDVVGPSLLQLSLRHERGVAGIGAAEGPLLPVAEHTVSRNHLVMRWVRVPVSSVMVCWPRAMGPTPLRTQGNWRPRNAWKPGRSTGRLSYSSRQKTRTANITSWASVRSVWVFGPARSRGPTGPGPPP